MSDLNNFKEKYNEWNVKTEKKLEKRKELKEEFKNTNNKPVKRVYTNLDTEEVFQELPGEFPYTRGVQPTMYRGRWWTMRQYAGFGTAEETNERYIYLLKNGQTGLSVAFDLPTQLGYDSDDPLSEGEVGKVGVAIDSIKDMRTLFNKIPLDKVSTSMTINAPAIVLLAMYIAVGEEQGVDPSLLKGTIQNDILKEYAARGTYIFPPAHSMKLITDIFEYCAEKLPKFNTISISGYHIREAGSTPAQEVAFTIADGLAYIEAALKKGLDIDSFAPRLSFFFNAHNGFFEEIAKFRAARRLWSTIVKERYNPKNPKSLMLRFHTQTGGSALTAQQPDNNIVRVAIQALSAVLGGTQSLHTNSRDEALALPTEQSVMVALRTQQMIAEETGVCNTVDPLAGSYYVETLTNEIEKEAKKYIQKIDDMGGAVKAVENGYIQKEIQNSSYKYQLELEKNERTIVGMNKYQVEEKPPENLLRVDKTVEMSQKKQLSEFKENRENKKEAKDILEKLKNLALTDENLFPIIIDAVKNNCTLGEICNVLRDVYGEYTDQIIL